MNKLLLPLLLSILPASCFASSGTALPVLDVTNTPLSWLAVALFVVAYLFVMTEEITHLRKSKPVIVCAGFIWVIVAEVANYLSVPDKLSIALNHNILEFAQLFLFLLVAMTYVNVMEERLVFEALRSYLVRKNFSFKQLFWATGLLSFCLSPVADNLTTALLMCAVVMAVGGSNRKFIGISCINIVVAANAGGAFSPFGDITTLMVWQSGLLGFFEFFKIFLPSLVSYLVPAIIMSFAIQNSQVDASSEPVKVKYGAYFCVLLFLLTILTAIMFHHFLHLPPMMGMMTGLGYLTFYAYYVKEREVKMLKNHQDVQSTPEPFDIFNMMKDAEWDSLFFFYGVILCVGGLATLGYLGLVSHLLYDNLGASLPAIHQATPANVIVGILSAIVDNIPVMFAVLTMQPDMSHGQWLLVTLTAGIGGSLLSIGSAAGVALMGQAKGIYTFMSHLKWTWAIFLGYVLGILCHLWWSADLFVKTIH